MTKAIDTRLRASTRLAAAIFVALTSVVLSAGAAQADEVSWGYVAQFQDRETCEITAERYYNSTPGEFRCISNGNPASSNDTYALYQMYYH